MYHGTSPEPRLCFFDHFFQSAFTFHSFSQGERAKVIADHDECTDQRNALTMTTEGTMMSFDHGLFQMNPCLYGTQLSGSMLMDCHSPRTNQTRTTSADCPAPTDKSRGTVTYIVTAAGRKLSISEYSCPYHDTTFVSCR